MELEELYGLMERFASSGLTELDWRREDERVTLRRAPAQVIQAAAPAAPVVPAAPAAPAAAAAPAAPEAEEGDLVRRILGTGHSLGILAQRTGLEQTRALLEEGNQLLEALVRTRTTVACVPEGQQTALEREGWICWEETLALAPSDTVGANTFASNTLRRLEGRTRSTYLTMEGGENTARVLSSLLRQLENNSFVVTIPAETRL